MTSPITHNVEQPSWLQTAYQALQRGLMRWTEPHTSVTDDEERLRARLMAALTSLTFTLGLLGLILQAFSPTNALPLNVIILPSSVINHLLSRSRYYRISIISYTVAAFVTLYLATLLSPAPKYYAIAMLVPVTLASLFWSPRWTTMWTGIAAGCVINVIGFAPQHRYLLFTTLLFLIVPALGSIYMTVMRHRYQALFLSQTARLKSNEGRYRNLFEITPVSLWEEDFSEVKHYLINLRRTIHEDLGIYLHNHPAAVEECIRLIRVIDVNESTLKMYKAASKEELLARFDEIIRDTEPDSLIEELLIIADGNTSYERGDHINFSLDGMRHNVWLRWVAVPGYEHDLGRVLVTIEDVTNRYQIEEQRLALRMERERVQLLSRFIGDASHDLNTAITVIKTMLYLVNRQSTPEQQPRLSIMDTQVTRLQTMIQDMLTVARFEQRTQETLRLQRVNLPTTIQRLVTQYNDLGKTHNQQFVYLPTADLPTFKADSVILERALESLFDNALKHTPDGTRIEIRTTYTNGQIKISVSDTGAGMPPDVLSRIFDYFYRGDAHRPQNSGMGLGLSLARNIITAHGGTLTAESQVGQGTTFHVTLPIENHSLLTSA